MRKIFLPLLFVAALSPLKPCGQGVFIRKAFRVAEISYRQSRLGSITSQELDRSLRLYYEQLTEACDECLSYADANYQYLINRLEYLLEQSLR